VQPKAALGSTPAFGVLARGLASLTPSRFAASRPAASLLRFALVAASHPLGPLAPARPVALSRSRLRAKEPPLPLRQNPETR